MQFIYKKSRQHDFLRFFPLYLLSFLTRKNVSCPHLKNTFKPNAQHHLIVMHQAVNLAIHCRYLLRPFATDADQLKSLTSLAVSEDGFFFRTGFLFSFSAFTFSLSNLSAITC
ncbi:hypothetical protein C7433_105147 [Pantoea sp. PNA 03-3]|nr:hypothetical protein C7433_105147 [Pantoea sp. PNA 03-3]